MVRVMFSFRDKYCICIFLEGDTNISNIYVSCVYDTRPMIFISNSIESITWV